MTRVKVNQDNCDAVFVRKSLGQSKEEIERNVVNTFDAFWKHNGVNFNWTPNPQNDHDFSLNLPGGEVSLELTEAVLLSAPKSSPYKQGAQKIDQGQLIDAIINAAEKKAEHYQKAPVKPLHLLIYTTDYSLIVNDEITAALQLYFSENVSIFEQIFFCDPSMQEIEIESSVRVLYPVPSECFSSLNVKSARSREIVIFDPRDWHASN